MPVTLTERYVRADAAGGGGGTSELDAWTYAEAEVNCTGAMLLHCKAAGTAIDMGSSVGFKPAPTGVDFDAPCIFQGYVDTPGDATLPVTWFKITGTPAIQEFVIDPQSDHCHFRYLGVESNASVNGRGFNLTDNSGAYRCGVKECETVGFWLRDGTYAAGCAVRNASPGFYLPPGSAARLVTGCVADGFSGTSVGIYLCDDDTVIDHCMLLGCVYGVWDWSVQASNSGAVATNNIFYANAIGFMSSGRSRLHLMNNVFDSQTSYGVTFNTSAGKANSVFSFGNAFYNNRLGDFYPGYGVLFEPGGRIQLPRSPFMDAASLDFRLSGSAPDALRAAWPENFIDTADFDRLIFAGGAAVGATAYTAGYQMPSLSQIVRTNL